MIPNPPGYLGVTPSPVTEGVGMQVTQQDIADAATDNGLFGAALCVHSSLSSFGHVSGGARTVVDGMLDAGCTVMAPAFCYTFAATPPPGRWLPRNAWDYGWPARGLVGSLHARPQRHRRLYGGHFRRGSRNARPVARQ